MKVLIIEDEKLAAEKLKKLLEETGMDMEILDIAELAFGLVGLFTGYALHATVFKCFPVFVNPAAHIGLDALFIGKQNNRVLRRGRAGAGGFAFDLIEFEMLAVMTLDAKTAFFDLTFPVIAAGRGVKGDLLAG